MSSLCPRVYCYAETIYLGIAIIQIWRMLHMCITRFTQKCQSGIVKIVHSVDVCYCATVLCWPRTIIKINNMSKSHFGNYVLIFTFNCFYLLIFIVLSISIPIWLLDDVLLLCHFSMKPLGLPTTKHVLVFL